MGLTSEAWAKLGIDTSSVPADLAKANKAFDKFLNELKNKGTDTGSGVGDKFAHGLGKKLLDAKHLSTSLATALGLNIENIAHAVTGALVGGSLEGWKQMGEMADREAQLIEKRIEAALTPKALAAKIKKDQQRAMSDLQGKKGMTETEVTTSMLSSQVPLLGLIAEKLGIVRSEEEKRQQIGEANLKIIESTTRVEEGARAIKESHTKLAEYEADLLMRTLTGTKLIDELTKRRRDIQTEINAGKLSEIEIDEKKKKMMDLGVQITNEQNRLLQVGIDKQKELLRLRISLVEAQRKLAKDEQDLANKQADRGKLDVDEIANLKPGQSGTQFGESSRVDTFGLSEEASRAKETAAEIQRMQKKAESLRLSGDSSGANALLNQIDTKKQTLVDSGFAKSTEGDQFKQLKESIHDDNIAVQKILTDIADVAKGKLRNE